ncbi:sortase [Streptomyces sp. NPDC006733]|uniref:sortase n=1 Tax=Streptomyces sp. NPDC006733 TaxID=3155460 RepID=UPI003411D2F8
MTVLAPPPPALAAPEPAADPPAAAPRVAFAGAALCVLAALLLGFAANLTVVGHLQHARDQRTAYDDLRAQLAMGTAPVGQTTFDGKPLDVGAPMALLRIPALGTKQVVFEGTASGVLRSGPGHRRDTPFPGQAGTSQIMGRAWGYGGPFNDIARLPIGSVIRVTTGQSTAEYRVTGIRRDGDPLPAVLAAGKGRLTLVTATGGAYTPSGVVRVDADLVSETQPSPPRPRRAGWIEDAEKPLGSESGAWLSVYLWSQALLAAALLTVWLHRRWGRWQTWITAVPVLAALGIAASGAATCLLPNLL